MSTDNAPAGPPADQPYVYFISGHGDEDAEPFEVPDGCYLVVKSEACMLASAYAFHDDFDNLLKMEMDEIRHPDTEDNRIKLRNAFGKDCTIYGPGKICPNFRYYLCNVHIYDDHILVDSYVGSGVIPIDMVKDYRDSLKTPNVQKLNTTKSCERPISDDFYMIPKNDTTNRPLDELIGNVLWFYRSCVYPPKKVIEDYLYKKWKGKENVTLYNMVKDLHNTEDQGFKAEIRPTQQELFRTSKGIYYHNVCRALSSKLQHYGKQLNIFKNPNSSPSCPSVKNMLRNPIYRELVKESLVRRRNEKRFQNSNYAKNKLHQSALQNVNTLQKRINIIEEKKKDVNRGAYSNNEKNRLIQEINRDDRWNTLSRALHNAQERCNRYNRNNHTRGRERGREMNTPPHRSRSKSPIKHYRGGKNKTRRKRC